MHPKTQEALWYGASAKHTGKTSISGLLLGVVGIAGVIAIGLVAPNALKLLQAIPTRNSRRSDKKSVDQTLKKLIHQQFIHKVRRNGVGFYELTEKGEAQLARLQLSMGALTTPKKWDGKWRMVIYDISEKRRSKRILLLRLLYEAGFYHLQDSVWVYPYPCRELSVLLKFHFALGKEVLYIEAAEIELEPELLRYFGLQRD